MALVLYSIVLLLIAALLAVFWLGPYELTFEEEED